MRNKFIIDVMLFIQGINFLVDPHHAPFGIAKTIAMTVFFACFGILVGFALTKGFKKTNLRTILITTALSIISVLTFFTPKYLADIFQFSIAIIIILSGLINILSVYHLTKLSATKRKLETKLRNSEKKDKAMQPVASAFENSIKTEAERMLEPAVILSKKATRFRFGQILINLLLVIVGIVLLFFRFHTNAFLLRVSGIIIIFTSIADLFALFAQHLWYNKPQKHTKNPIQH